MTNPAVCGKPPPLHHQWAWEVSPSRFMGSLLGITPYDWQVDILDGADRFRLMNASRQSGKTETADVGVAHQMLFDPGSLAVVVTHALPFSAEFVRRVRRLLLQSGLAPPPWPMDNVHSIELPIGSRLLGLPATERVRGYTKPKLVILDEAAQIPDRVFHAITPTQAANYATARLWALSTPYGQRGWWYHEWVDGGEHWWRIRKPATEVPHIHPDILARARRNMLKYRSEYGCEFVGTSEQVFSPELLSRMFCPSGALPREMAETADALGEICADGGGMDATLAAPRLPQYETPSWLRGVDWTQAS